nr:GTP-binding protein [uncultured Desulfobulbus sp.]
MTTTRLLFIGGFLGAGKTTLLDNISQRLIDQGQTVGLITNDQAPALVDTLFLAQHDKEVAEVSGSCFCCNFEGLLDAIHQLQKEPQPTVILAEPVGSCTDLSATILQPLKEQLDKDLVLSPLSVVVDAQRLRNLFQGHSTGLHTDSEYIFRKQMEEADTIVVNKIDRIDANEIAELRGQLSRQFPNASAFFLSAKTGEGVEEWLDAVMERNDCGNHIVEVDYDRYAEGEAVLGWLNATMSLEGSMTDWKEFAANLMAELGRQLDQRNVSVGHVKIILSDTGAAPIIANLTGTQETLDVRGAAIITPTAQLTINARAEMTPQQLEILVRQTLDSACGNTLAFSAQTWQSLSPGRPTPTHRYAHVVPFGA